MLFRSASDRVSSGMSTAPILLADQYAKGPATGAQTKGSQGLSHSLSWISAKPWLPFVCAPVAGPFAYWSASKMGAVDMPELTLSLAALALGWLVVFPLLLYIRKTLYPELVQ